MKNKKEILITLIIMLTVILILVFCKSCERDMELDNSNSNNIDNVEVNPYVMEFETEKYEGRVLESETKEYITLFIETKLFEEKEKIEITYDSEKYILDRANPIVGNLLPESVEGAQNRKYFHVELEPITNYSIDFIKKNPQSEPMKADVELR